MEDNRNLPEESEQKATKPAKSEKPKEKKPNIFVRTARAIRRFFSEYKSEMKKVTWMNATDVRKSSLLVCVSVVIVGVAVLGIDSAFSLIINLLGKLY